MNQTVPQQVALFYDRQTTTDWTTNLRHESDKLVYGSLHLFFQGGQDARGVRDGKRHTSNTRVDETEIRLTCSSLAKTSELIRSLRDDEKVKSQEPGMRKWLPRSR